MYKIEKYYLIDWGCPANQFSRNKEVYMTSEEAQIKNKDLVLGQTSLRYVKANPRKFNKDFHKVKTKKKK